LNPSFTICHWSFINQAIKTHIKLKIKNEIFIEYLVICPRTMTAEFSLKTTVLVDSHMHEHTYEDVSKSFQTDWPSGMRTANGTALCH
jgi:hypothetical protein